MIWLLCLLSTLYSIILVFALLPTASRSFKLGLGLLLPIIIISWTSLGLAAVLPMQLAISLAWGSFLIVAAALYIYVWKKKKVPILRIRLNRSDWPLVLFLGLYVFISLYLLKTHSLMPINGGWQGAGSTWGDLALHATFINYFLHQEWLSLRMPIYTQINITYPFLFDWYTSSFIRLGASIQQALIISQFQGLLALFFLLFAVARQLLRQRGRAILGMVLFLLGSGSFGWWYWYGDWQDSNVSLFEFLRQMRWQYTNMPDRGVFFSNVINDMFLPQRGYVIGLAVTAAILSLTFMAERATKRHLQSCYLVTAAVLLSVLPFFHAHAFLWAGGWLALYLLRRIWKQKALDRTTIISAAVVLLFAGAQLLWYRAQGVGNQNFFWQPGWMWTFQRSSTIPDLAATIMTDLGWLTLTALIIIPLQLVFRRRWQLFDGLLGYSWLWFAICLLFSFQPWPYDNVKLMMTSFLIFCIWMAEVLSNFWHRSKYLGKLAVGILCILTTLSGFISLVREVTLGSELASKSELRFAEAVRPLLDPTGNTLIALEHNHPIPMLVGQPVVMGYPGWLWTYGISADQTNADVRTIYQNPLTAKRLLQKYQVRYVVIGPRERAQYQIPVSDWQQLGSVFYADDETMVLELTTR